MRKTLVLDKMRGKVSANEPKMFVSCASVLCADVLSASESVVVLLKWMMVTH